MSVPRGKYRDMGQSVHFYPQYQQVSKNYGTNLLKNGSVWENKRIKIKLSSWSEKEIRFIIAFFNGN